MVSKSKSVGIAVIVVLLLTLSLSLVSAQYATEKTTDVTIPSNGIFIASESTVGVSYSIQGTSGATGTVTVDVYNGNPQPTATFPNGISLTGFVAITLNMKANDFTQAKITIAYTNSEVQGLSQPYTIFKYDLNSNRYVALPSIIDTTSKTLTVTLTNINDPLLAIGGTTSSAETSSGVPAWTWAVIAAVIIVIVVIAVLILRHRNPFFYVEKE